MGFVRNCLIGKDLSAGAGVTAATPPKLSIRSSTCRTCSLLVYKYVAGVVEAGLERNKRQQKKGIPLSIFRLWPKMSTQPCPPLAHRYSTSFRRPPAWVARRKDREATFTNV